MAYCLGMKASVSSFWDSDIKMIKRIMSAGLLLVKVDNGNYPFDQGRPVLDKYRYVIFER